MERFFCFVFLGSIESSVPISPQKLKGTCNFTLLCALPSRVGGTQGSQALCPALKPALHWGRYNGWILCRLYYRHEQNACFYTRWARHFNKQMKKKFWTSAIIGSCYLSGGRFCENSAIEIKMRMLFCVNFINLNVFFKIAVVILNQGRLL